jgi:hypothetical protein
MARRTRTTKTLAQRIDLSYFKKLYPIPRWRRILSLGLATLGLVWLGFAGKRAISAGPLARSHVLFTRNCAACHALEAAFGKKVSDRACRSCHNVADHQARQTFTPACIDCHVEHQGSFRLSQVRDEACTQCHASLKTKDGNTHFAANITSFDNGHPDFAALRPADPAVKFSHEVHLKQDLRGSRGGVELKCGDCHSASRGAYMAPVDYQKHCAECHPLAFDKRFSDAAPHVQPEVVIEYITRRFTDYIAAHPAEVSMSDPADPRIVKLPPPPARDKAEWISRRVADAEQLLWRKSCAECHTLSFRGAIPEVQAAAPTTRWMKHASFDHFAHQMLGCTECHAQESKSRESVDMLLPGIQTCRSCHRSGAESAESRCFECHAYHARRSSS